MSSLRFRALVASCLLAVLQQQPVFPHKSNAAAPKNSAVLPAVAPDWHANMVGTPVSVTVKLPNGCTTSYMFYTARSATSTDVNLELAIAADGVNYRRLPLEQSPHAAEGEVLSARQVVGNNSQYSSVRLGAPMIAQTADGLNLTFYHVEMQGEQAVSAGIARAESVDGIHWRIDDNQPMTINFTGRCSDDTALESRLNKLSSACAQM